jgi:LacI family transcriptional regulator
VDADEAGSAHLLVRHLWDLGHRRIGFVTREGWASAGLRARDEGWREAMRWAAMAAPPESWLLRSSTAPDAAHAWDAKTKNEFARLLSAPEALTAFACSDDVEATYLYKAAADLGLRIPANLSVAGCRGTYFGDYLHPRLTGVRIPWELVAHFAVDKLIEQIRQPQDDPCIAYVIRSDLVVRESTAPISQVGATLAHPAVPAEKGGQGDG